MANTRDIKRRITSVNSIGHITKAMEMVAGAKLRRAQANVVAAKPYITQLTKLMNRLQTAGLEVSDPLLKQGTGADVYIVIASDRGLSGAYNANVLRFAQETAAAAGGSIFAVGRKAERFFKNRSKGLAGAYCCPQEGPRYEDALAILKPLLDQYRIGGAIGSLHLIYTEFISALSLKPTVVQLLPLASIDATAEAAFYLYEPSAEDVLGQLLPHYLYSVMYHGLLESKAAEYAAQRMAMKSATDNASEMIDQLTLSFNRARQTAITQEILEVVNGAQALEG